MNKCALNQLLRENIIQNRDTQIIIQPDGTNMIYTWSREKLLSKKPDEDLIDKISPNPQSRYIHRWNNGRIGAIFPGAGGHILDFCEYELYDGPDDNLGGVRPVKMDDDDNEECKEPLAFGIMAYYLNMRNRKDPKDIFADYLEYDKTVFNTLQEGAMDAWNPNKKKDFPYSEHYKLEKRNIRISSQIYDFLGQSAARKLNEMAVNYLRYVKSQITNITFRDLTRNEEKECFKRAVLRVMWSKNEQGDDVFHKNKQWIAVYCYAVDFCLLLDDDDFYKSEYDVDLDVPEYKKGISEACKRIKPIAKDSKQKKAFDCLTQELQLDQESTVRIPFKHDIDLSIETYKRYSKPYPWPKDGLKGTGPQLYEELDEVYRKLNEEYHAIEVDINTTLT